jgi:glycerol-3-phosphate acyltransferase PlsY
MIVELVAVVIVAYLIGSIPFGLIIGRLKGNVDISKYGSGKIGATNVMRTVGTKAGVVTIALDLVKALAAVMLARVIVGSDVLTVGGISINWQVAQVMAGLAAIAGHNWSIFAKFKGGSGVAAFFGTMYALYPPAALFGSEIWAAVAIRSRYMSMGSILGVLATWCLMVPLTIFYNFPPVYLVYGLIAVGLVLYRHRGNIRRLQLGMERRLGEREQTS